MIHFDNDYTEGAHEKILSRLLETNNIQMPGYGLDDYSEKARNLIKKATKKEDIDVHFLVGGTQTNLTVIAASLRPYEGVVTADSGHIHTLETGARSEEHTSELQSRGQLVCRLLLEKKKNIIWKPPV